MFVKAGLLSLLLLVASRLLGVLRETALAATFGTSGMADVVILMLTLPDWLAGVLAGGALAYVLVPHWAKQPVAQQNVTQNRVAMRLLWVSLGMVVAMCIAPAQLGALLVPGVSPALQGAARQAVVWSALALPAAMLAGLWATRLQHERDFVGLYSANLVVNVVLIFALVLVGTLGAERSTGPILGVFLLVAVCLRLLWQSWRLRRVRHASLPPAPAVPLILPGWRIWLWAVLGAGLPLTLPFLARTLASTGGEGALATFNYAWKLVELPLVLAIQLVASLAFPAIAQAHARQAPIGGADSAPMACAVRNALVLCWTLACAAAAALLVGASAITTLLFGWGAMEPAALVQVTAWGVVGAWSLLPQALLAVALVVLATVGRMRFGVLAYALALAVLLLAGGTGRTGGAELMWALNLGFLVAALVAWAAVGASALQLWVPVRGLLAPLAALGTVAVLERWLIPMDVLALPALGMRAFHAAVLILSAASAMFVIAFSWFSGAALRQALRS